MIETSRTEAIEDTTSKSRPTQIVGQAKDRGHVETDSPLTAPTRSQNRKRLTDKDRQLIGVVAIARYLSNDQVQTLFYSGRSCKTMRKRLRSLAGAGYAPFNPPYLRHLSYRTQDGCYVDLWALTAAGYAAAQTVLGSPLKVPREDVGPAFREHTVALNELLVGLIAPSTGMYARAQQTSFRWIMSDVARLPWRQYLQNRGTAVDRVIVPDAVLEIPASRRRIFLECEMGTHSVVPTTDQKPGATLSKLDNYDGFIRGFADASKRETFYSRSYRDGWTPEVLLLLRSTARTKTVNEAIEKWRKRLIANPFAVRALTFDQARDELVPLVRGGTPLHYTPGDSDGTAQLVLLRDEVALLREFYNSTVLVLKTVRGKARARQEPPPEYPHRTEEVQALIQRLQGAVTRPMQPKHGSGA